MFLNSNVLLASLLGALSFISRKQPPVEYNR